MTNDELRHIVENTRTLEKLRIDLWFMFTIIVALGLIVVLR